MNRKEEAIRYSIVVPFFNEQESILPLYVKITEVMDGLGDPYEMIFVDDGSRDQTYRILNDIYENDRRVHVVRLRRNFGQTPALKAGFDFAQGDVIISMDGDQQHDPADIPLFIEKIKEGFDIASGWRADRQDPWLTRKFPSRVANWMMAKLSGVPLHDFGTTFKAYRREIIQQVQLYGEMHRFIPALAKITGASIVEVPIRHFRRPAGKSNYNLSRTTRVFFDLISIKFMLDYVSRPLHLFGKLAVLSFLGGAGIGGFLAWEKIVHHEHVMLQHGPLMLTGMFLLVTAFQFLSLGLIGELLSRTYFESQNKPIYNVREIRSRRETVEPAGRSDSSGPWQS